MAKTDAEPTAPTASRTNLLRGPWLPALLALLCMLNSLGNHFTYDDLPVVRDNPRIRNLADFHAIWLSNWWEATNGTETENARRDPLYRPLSLFTFALNYAVHGLRPLGFHATNITFHVFATLLVWLFARRLTHDPDIPPITAALFAVHPIHVEAVANLVGRAEILATIFLLLGFLTLMPRNHTPRITRTAAAAALFFLALLAKETAICYPAVALLILHWRHPDQRRQWKWWLTHLGILLIPLLIYFPLRYVALDGRLLRTEPAGALMNPVVLAEGFQRLTATLTVLGHYSRLILVPSQLCCDYGFAVIDPRRGFEPITLLGLATALAAIVGLLGFTRRSYNWRFSATLTAISIASYLLISNSFLLIGVSVGERLMYWPSVPILLLIAFAAVRIYRHETTTGRRLARSAGVLRLLGLAVLVALALRTAVRNTDWADTFTLARVDVETHPRSAHLNRGLAFELFDIAKRMQDPEARHVQLQQVDRLLQRALNIEPAYPDALALRAQVRYLLDPQDPQARRLAQAALRIEPHNRNALRVLAQIEGGVEAVDARLTTLRQRVEANPENHPLRLEYARTLLGLGQPDDARHHLEYLRQADPDNPEVLRLLGETLALSGRPAEARETLTAALQFNPDDWRIHANLSKLLADVDPAACLRHARRAYELQPNDRRVAINLAEALVLNNQPTQALQLYEAIRQQLPPDDPYRAILNQRIRNIKTH